MFEKVEGLNDVWAYIVEVAPHEYAVHGYTVSVCEPWAYGDHFWSLTPEMAIAKGSENE